MDTGFWPIFSIQKVKSVWSAKGDMSSWCETGLSYDVFGVEPRQFVAWCGNGLYDDGLYSFAPWNSSQRFNTGYRSADARHYFWFNGVIVTSIPKGWVGQMTAGYPGTHAEVDGWLAGETHDNTASFSTLKWQSASFNDWLYWGTSGTNFFDNDPTYANHIGNNTVLVY